MSITITAAGRQILDDKTSTRCLCWRVRLEDSTLYRWTNHDEDIYLPFRTSPTAERFRVATSGARAANVRRQAGLKDHSTSVSGVVISNGDVLQADLQAGRWRNARFEELLVDWNYPWLSPLGEPAVYRLRDVRFTGEIWTGELRGLSNELDREQGIYLNRTCRHPFGGAFGADPSVVGCRYDVASDTVLGAVSSVTDRRIFQTNLTEADDYWRMGELTFSSGANARLRPIRVKEFRSATNEIELTLPTPFDIEVGDQFTVARGCEKTKEQCELFGQFPLRFGGSNLIPSEDEIRSRPLQN